MQGNKGPLGKLVEDPEQGQALDSNGEEIPREIIEKVLEEVGSLQYAMVMERLAGIEDKMDDLFSKLEETNKILRNKL